MRPFRLPAPLMNSAAGMNAKSSPIYVDLRPFQDPAYQRRGVGFHLSALLQSRMAAGADRFSIKGLADPALPPPPEDLAALFDDVFLASAVPLRREPAIYLDGSPMTHEPMRTVRFLGRADILHVAVIYDFIQLDRPGYLPDPRSRIEFLLRLRRLRNFDVFCPISEFSAKRTRELLSGPTERIHVTGASVRESLFPAERPSGEIQHNEFNQFG